VCAFELVGSLFFGAVGKIESLQAQLPAGTRAVVLEMHRLILLDTSGLAAILFRYVTQVMVDDAGGAARLDGGR
jgi:hypothetical protein